VLETAKISRGDLSGASTPFLVGPRAENNGEARATKASAVGNPEHLTAQALRATRTASRGNLCADYQNAHKQVKKCYLLSQREISARVPSLHQVRNRLKTVADNLSTANLLNVYHGKGSTEVYCYISRIRQLRGTVLQITIDDFMLRSARSASITFTLEDKRDPIYQKAGNSRKCTARGSARSRTACLTDHV
jgi:hypothetical protein